jgi:hypothetical protein
VTPPVVPAPQPDPEKRLDRLITVRTAVLAALATVLASVISGIGAAVVTSNMQAHAQTQQFLRTQRQALYSGLLADEADFYVQLFDFQDWLNGKLEPVTVDAFHARRAAADKAHSLLYKDYASVALIGSDPTVEAAKVVVNGETSLYGTLLKDFSSCTSAHRAVTVCSTTYTDAKNREKALTDARNTFSDAAKTDLQG